MKIPRRYGSIWLLLLIPAFSAAQQKNWVATWETGLMAARPDAHEPLLNIEDQTVRERVRISVGGTQLCIRLSNEFGSTPLRVGSVTVAISKDVATVKQGSIRSVTFGGSSSVTIPPGAPLLSDPVPLSVPYGAEISISLYFPGSVKTPTVHRLALKHAVVSQHGDYTHAEGIKSGIVSESSIVLGGVLVPAQPSQRLVVAFGDSLTDGDGSTMEADHNWPSDLVRRLGKRPDPGKIAVVNAGIAGNRLLQDGFGIGALARFDRDALQLPGVTHIILIEGLNDIGFPGAKLQGTLLADPNNTATADDLIYAYRQLILRAHARGVRVIGATINPFEGVDLPGYYSESKEAVRQAVNKWIRTSGVFDGVIDVDTVLRDPSHPSRLLPRFDSQDHLHPNDLGYQALADSIDLALLD
jgi:lysophospholipase L1-like esterase